jgi:hypothetical protein
MRVIVAILLLSFALTGVARSPTAETVTFGNRVITVGDSVGRLFEVAGKPDRTIQLENGNGANTGERFEYYRDGKTILIEISAGRVVAIEEIRS